jgi:hypothetical protein
MHITRKVRLSLIQYDERQFSLVGTQDSQTGCGAPTLRRPHGEMNLSGVMP